MEPLGLRPSSWLPATVMNQEQIVKVASLNGAMERVGENFSLFYETVLPNVGQRVDESADCRRQNVVVEQPGDEQVTNLLLRIPNLALLLVVAATIGVL